MTVRIAEYAEPDAPGLRELLTECVAFYDQPPEDVDRLLAARDDTAGLGLLLAHDGDRVVGFAAYSELWPADVGTTLYLKELFVSGAARGLGVGALLMTALQDEARRRGCEGLEWRADGDNEAAQRFYARLPVRILDKVAYRIDL